MKHKKFLFILNQNFTKNDSALIHLGITKFLKAEFQVNLNNKFKFKANRAKIWIFWSKLSFHFCSCFELQSRFDICLKIFHLSA